MGCAFSGLTNLSGKQPPQSDTIVFKILCVGAKAVGKTAVITRYLKNDFIAAPIDPCDKTNAELGLKFISTSPLIQLELWEVPSAYIEEVLPEYCAGVDGAVVVTDATNPRSFKEAVVWKEILTKTYQTRSRNPEEAINREGGETSNTSTWIPAVLIVNKADSENAMMRKSEVEESVKAFQFKAGVIGSAKTGASIHQAFQALVEAMLAERTARGQSGLYPLKSVPTISFTARTDESTTYTSQLTTPRTITVTSTTLA